MTKTEKAFRTGERLVTSLSSEKRSHELRRRRIGHRLKIVCLLIEDLWPRLHRLKIVCLLIEGL